MNQHYITLTLHCYYQYAGEGGRLCSGKQWEVSRETGQLSVGHGCNLTDAVVHQYLDVSLAQRSVDVVALFTSTSTQSQAFTFSILRVLT